MACIMDPEWNNISVMPLSYTKTTQNISKVEAEIKDMSMNERLKYAEK